MHVMEVLGHGGEGIGGKVFDAPSFRPLGRMRTSPARLVRIPRGMPTKRSEKQSVWEITWTRSKLTAVYWKHLSPAWGAAAAPSPDRIRQQPVLLHVAVQSGVQRVKAKVSFPQFLLYHGRDDPTPLRVFTCCGSTRVWEPRWHSLRFIKSKNIPVSSAAAQWMNKDRKHKTFILKLPEVTTLQPCWWHVLLIQPWVKLKHSVYWIHVDDDTFLVGGNYIGTAPVSSIF